MTMGNDYTSGYAREMPSIGARVVTADGHELGNVKEVAGSCFKLDVSMQPDYWLSADAIDSSSETELRLSIGKDGVDDYKVDPPPDSGVQL
jgi:hypothetical protein